MGSPHGQEFGEPIGGSKEKSDGKTPTRGLLADVTAPEAAKRSWIYSTITNPVYGGFIMNVLADIFVRILVLIATFLIARLFARRMRKRELSARDLDEERNSREDAALHPLLEILELRVRFQGSPETPPVLKVVSSTAQSSSTAPPPVPESHALITGSIPAGSIPGSSPQATSSTSAIPTTGPISGSILGSPTSSTNAVPTEPKKAVQTTNEQRDQLGRRNGYIIKSRSMGQATSTFSESPPVATPGPDVAKDHHVIDFIFLCHVARPTETTKVDEFKDTVKEKQGVVFDDDVCSSRMMQARVPATEKNLSALREVAIEGMKLDDGFTLQIGASFLYCCTGNREEPVLLSLRDVEVPTVLQAEYSAGMLTVRGRYLEGAEIRAATSEGYMILTSVKQDPVDNDSLPEKRVGTWRCTDLLPPVRLEQIRIFASKRVHVEGQSITVRSKVCSIQDTTLRTVIYKWMPAIIMMSILASQLWQILELFFDLMTNLLHPWLFYPILELMMYTIQHLSPSLEENVNYFIERLKLAISSFHVFPKPLASPPFFMRNGYCFQRGARYFFYPSPSLPQPPKVESHDKPENTTEEKQSPKQESGNLVTKRDWKWPSWKMSLKSETYEKFDPDSSDHGLNSDDDVPFEVLYGKRNYSFQTAMYIGRDSQYLPKDVNIKLYSKHLQNVVRECIPNKMKQFESYAEIQAQHLLILYLNGKLSGGNYDSCSNLSSTSNNEHEKNDLHLFHLKRFVEKEYTNVINQYKRMMKVGVISWDMLWTLIVPGIDVIYYCEISNQELCGKVSLSNYEIENDIFSIDLEVYDFDCNNFEVVNVSRELDFFKDDVKIINLEVFPLQCQVDPQESEKQLFQRGRVFCDLVLKYERRFMHYFGLMYETPKIYDNSRESTERNEGIHSIKASIDGRVMIDQKWFAKLKPWREMGTARASGWNPINDKPDVRIKAQADEFDSLLKYSPAIAYGYSFSIRKWGCFDITRFSDIPFVSTAFDKLVMKEGNKLALLTLTEYYINIIKGGNNVAAHIDILPNKGQGCIIVLHGPPGTGKTLTVESLAERFECPLWQLSISKLTASTKKLENKLLATFEVAKSWGAILVLDEADVYLSSRTYSPIGLDNTPNNAMTGVFLRVLEHYKGVLFLTTNIMSRIEPAVFSRISMFIKYEEFNTEERKKLWTNFLEEAKISDLSEDFWKKILPAQFNGRVIRNIVHRAQILIQSKNFERMTPEECLLIVFDAMTDPSTMKFLVESHENDQPTPEAAPITLSAPPDSFISD